MEDGDMLAACFDPSSGYSLFMSANELLEKVRHLPSRERGKFFDSVYELEDSLALSTRKPRQQPVRWPEGGHEDARF